MKKYLQVFHIRPLAFVTALSICFFVLLSANNRMYYSASTKTTQSPKNNTCTEKLKEADMQMVKALPEKILQLLQ